MLETYKLAHLPVDEASLGKSEPFLFYTFRNCVIHINIYFLIDRVVEILSLFPSTEVGRKSFISNAFRYVI
jgi:hypothetical protein